MLFKLLQVSKTDNLSKTMCQNCMDLLNGCITFRDVCQRTNEKLIQLSKQKGVKILFLLPYLPLTLFKIALKSV